MLYIQIISVQYYNINEYHIDLEERAKWYQVLWDHRFFSVVYFFPCSYKCRHALGNPPVFFGVDPTSAISEFFLLSSIYNPLRQFLQKYQFKVIVLQCKTCNKITLFVCLMMESLWMLIATSSSGDEVNCLRVAICSTLFRCRWCISILIIRAVRWCSLLGPHWSAVEFFDRGCPGFGYFDYIIPIDVVGVKSYMDCLFDPSLKNCWRPFKLNA